MRQKLTQVLRAAELREEEVRLYLLLLKLKRSTIPELIQKSGLHHMMVYRSIKRLVERELVVEFPLNNKQSMYSALSLKALIQKIGKSERKLRKLELALKGLDRLLPFMDMSQDEESKDPEPIEIREGLDAFREEYLRFPDCCTDEYLHIGSMQNYWKTAQMTYECPVERNFIHRRLSRNIHCRILNIYTPDAEEFTRNDTREKRISKLTETLPIQDNYLGIADNHAAHFICDSDNPRVIVIRQPDLLGMYKGQFTNMWQRGI